MYLKCHQQSPVDINRSLPSPILPWETRIGCKWSQFRMLLSFSIIAHFPPGDMFPSLALRVGKGTERFQLRGPSERTPIYHSLFLQVRKAELSPTISAGNVKIRLRKKRFLAERYQSENRQEIRHNPGYCRTLEWEELLWKILPRSCSLPVESNQLSTNLVNSSSTLPLH